MHSRQSVLDYLSRLGIKTATIVHPAVLTVEQAQLHTHHLPGGHAKNLFLEDKRGGLWLISCLDRQSVKVNGLARLLGAPRFSFATPERLREVLGVEPGSVTPLALINDTGRRVKFVADSKLLACTVVNVHPLENTATTTISAAGLQKFVAALGYEPIIVDLDESLSA